MIIDTQELDISPAEEEALTWTRGAVAMSQLCHQYARSSARPLRDVGQEQSRQIMEMAHSSLIALTTIVGEGISVPDVLCSIGRIVAQLNLCLRPVQVH